MDNLSLNSHHLSILYFCTAYSEILKTLMNLLLHYRFGYFREPETLIKTAIFADVQNVYYTCREAFGKQFNYRALWNKITEEHQIEHAFAYAIDKGDSSQMGFQKALRHIGFEVKLKPYIQRKDGSAKGDWDVGITIDVMEAAAQVEKIVLLSGDGDFDLLLKHVHEKFGVQTLVYGAPGLTANSLKESAQRYIEIYPGLLQ